MRVSDITKHPDINKMKNDLKRRDLKAIAAGMVNVLEPVTASRHEIIYALKERMLEAGALNAMMSGSGPTVFGYFVKKTDALDAAEKIRRAEPDVKEVFLTQTYNPNHPNKKGGW